MPFLPYPKNSFASICFSCFGVMPTERRMTNSRLRCHRSVSTVLQMFVTPIKKHCKQKSIECNSIYKQQHIVFPVLQIAVSDFLRIKNHRFFPSACVSVPGSVLAYFTVIFCTALRIVGVKPCITDNDGSGVCIALRRIDTKRPPGCDCCDLHLIGHVRCFLHLFFVAELSPDPVAWFVICHLPCGFLSIPVPGIRIVKYRTIFCRFIGKSQFFQVIAVRCFSDCQYWITAVVSCLRSGAPFRRICVCVSVPLSYSPYMPPSAGLPLP